MFETLNAPKAQVFKAPFHIQSEDAALCAVDCISIALASFYLHHILLAWGIRLATQVWPTNWSLQAGGFSRFRGVESCMKLIPRALCSELPSGVVL